MQTLCVAVRVYLSINTCCHIEYNCLELPPTQLVCKNIQPEETWWLVSHGLLIQTLQQLAVWVSGSHYGHN